MSHQPPDQNHGPRLTRTGMALRIIAGTAIAAGIVVLATHHQRTLKSPPSTFWAAPHGGLSQNGPPGAHS